MPDAPPLGSHDYYDLYPSLMHQAGDIWSDLPSLGVLPLSWITGLVITPACDLDNRKVDSITYLPIVSIRQAFALRGFLPEITRATDGQLQQLGLKHMGIDAHARYVPPVPASLEDLAKRVRAKAKKMNVQKEASPAVRVLAAISLLRKAYGHEASPPTGSELLSLFGEKQLNGVINRIATNSYKSDIHFLPGDGQRNEWTVIPEPSLVLFRYPLSIPLELLDSAQDMARADWDSEVDRLSQCIVCASNIAARRPMKRLKLKPRFIADLVTRYISMYVRLGAPDFTDDAIRNYIAQVKEA